MALNYCTKSGGYPRDVAEVHRMRCAYTQGFYDAIIYLLGFAIVCTGIAIAALWVIASR